MKELVRIPEALDRNASGARSGDSSFSCTISTSLSGVGLGIGVEFVDVSCCSCCRSSLSEGLSSDEAPLEQVVR